MSFWVANLPKALGPNSLHLTKPAPYPEEESSKYAGPLARQGGHLCPPWLWKNASRGDRICERYSRHLVDVKCITLHLVFYAFSARTKRVNPLRPPIVNFQGWTRRQSTMRPLSRTVCQHAFRHPLFRVEASSSQRISASFSPRNSKLESWPTLWTLAPQCSRFNAYSRCSYVDGCGS